MIAHTVMGALQPGEDRDLKRHFLLALSGSSQDGLIAFIRGAGEL